MLRITANTTRLSESLESWRTIGMVIVEKALGLAEGMTYKGVHPVAELVTKVYTTGVKLSNQVRRLYEQALGRLPELPKWSITIEPDKARAVCALAEQLE